MTEAALREQLYSLAEFAPRKKLLVAVSYLQKVNTDEKVHRKVPAKYRAPGALKKMETFIRPGGKKYMDDKYELMRALDEKYGM